jgi:hypothetical protein
LLVASTALITGLITARLPTAIGSPVSAVGPTTSRFAALDLQIRVLDTRQAESPIQRLAAGGALSIDPVTADVAASAGVAKSDIVAVVANVTLDSADGWGFATVHPEGEGQPNSSSINTDTPGQTVANMVTARLGAGGRITIASSVGTDVIADVQGVYVRANESRSGRLITVPQSRAADTRESGPVPAGGSITVDLTPAGIPVSASAAVLNVTAAEARGLGFLTVWNGLGAPPNSSNVNYVGGSTVANQVIVPTANGAIGVFTHAESDVLVDVVGYMTGPGDPSLTAGLFIALGPARLFDSRQLEAPTFAEPIDGNARLSKGALGEVGIPESGVVAINTNTTLTETTASGFATIWGAGGVPGASSLNNVGANRTVANHVITDITDVGCINLYSSARTHAIIDVTGYFIGPAAPSPFAPLDLCDQTLTPPPVQPASPSSVGSHAFLFQPTPAPPGFGRWDPCAPQIKYAVNTLRATQREIDEMHHALREIERASGFDFVPYQPDPTTTEGLDDRRPPGGADFLIGFSDPSQTSQLNGSIVGIGGGFWFASTGRINSGFVIVDVPQLGDIDDLRATLVHELGHAIGLGHVIDPNQIMYPALTSRTTLGSGDKQGLWRLGTAQPCFSPAQRPADEEPVLVETTFGRDSHS